MSKDTIYRADAVSEIHKYFWEEIEKTPHGTDEDGEDVYTDMQAVNTLLAYNKQLSKRIKALSSAHPELDEWCHDCKEYDAERHCCPRWNKVIRQTVQDIKAESCWIPCSERLPEKEGWYITTVESEKTGKRRIENDLFAIDIALAHGHTPNKFCKDGYRQRTVAWMPFPEPYGGE